MQLENLKSKTLAEIREIAKDLGIKSITTYKKDDLISVILASQSKSSDSNSSKSKSENQNSNIQNKNQNQSQNQNNDTLETEGILEVMPDGYGFIRTDRFKSGESDVFVSPVQIRRFRLKTGDYIHGLIRINKDSDNFPPLIYLLKLNGNTPENAYKRLDFESLKPIYPRQKLNIEDGVTNRIISLASPIGKGQRGLIVSPPKTGKTTIIKSLANSIEKNYF